MRPGLHWVLANLDLRSVLTRRFGIKRWLCSDEQTAQLVSQVRQHFTISAEVTTAQESTKSETGSRVDAFCA